MGDITPLYQPGRNITGKVKSAAVVGGRFVMQNATKVDTGDAIEVKYPTSAAVATLGVTHGDAAVDEYVDILGPGHIVPVEVGTGGVTAGTAVTVDSAGRIVATATGNVVAGLCLQTKSAAAFAYVRVGPGHPSIG